MNAASHGGFLSSHAFIQIADADILNLPSVVWAALRPIEFHVAKLVGTRVIWVLDKDVVLALVVFLLLPLLFLLPLFEPLLLRQRSGIGATSCVAALLVFLVLLVLLGSAVLSLLSCAILRSGALLRSSPRGANLRIKLSDKQVPRVCLRRLLRTRLHLGLSDCGEGRVVRGRRSVSLDKRRA